MKKSKIVTTLEAEVRKLGAYKEAFYCLRKGESPIKLFSGEGNRRIEVELLGAARMSGGVVIIGGGIGIAMWASDWIAHAKTRNNNDPYVLVVASHIEREIERALAKGLK